MITRIAHACIGAQDLTVTQDFYTNVLGLKKAFEFHHNGALFGYYLEVGPGNYLEFFQQGSGEVHRDQLIRHLCLEVDNIDELVARLATAGVAVSPKSMGGDRSWQAWAEDPNGVKLEFHQYTERSSQTTGETVVL